MTREFKIFLKNAFKIYKGAYTYREYKTLRETFIITCKKHGDFITTPRNHLSYRSGCPTCKEIETTLIKKQDFIQKAEKLYPNRYSYQLVNINELCIDIVCQKHGVFTINKWFFLKKNGECPLCREKKNNSQAFRKFKIKAALVHGNKYDYSNSIYINARTNIEVLCPIHGKILQLPCNHIKGHGCEKCARSINIFSKKGWVSLGYEKSTFYCLHINTKDEEFYKIGITHCTIERRYMGRMPYEYVILLEEESTPEKVWEKENRFKKELKVYSYTPKIKFPGYTECYSFSSPVKKGVKGGVLLTT